MSLFFNNNSDFTSFVVSALVSEANKEGKRILLDYKTSFSQYDVFLPDGLSVFGKKYRTPYAIEIKIEPRLYESWITANDFPPLIREEFLGTKFIISNQLFIVPTQNRLEENYIYLGSKFVEKLAKRNPTAYLNHILQNTDVLLKDERNKTMHLLDAIEEKKPSKRKTKKSEKVINENDVNELCEANKNDFVAFLDREPGDSKCALIVGNGVSIPFGSDNWSSMIKNLVDHLEPFYIEKREDVEKALSHSSYALSSFVKRTLTREENDSKFIDAVRYCIYRKYNEMMHEQPTLVKVIAQAKNKYPSMPILTYNYDTFIEKQFRYETGETLGFFCNDYESDDFVKLATKNIIHLHGYIDYESKVSRGVVLADDDYCNSYLKEDSWTKIIQLKVLKDYNCLFIGSSMSDLFQMSLIQRARENDAKGKWNCFALMALDLGFKEKARIIKYFLEKGIKLIVAESLEKLPETLAGLFGIELK